MADIWRVSDYLRLPSPPLWRPLRFRNTYPLIEWNQCKEVHVEQYLFVNPFFINNYEERFFPGQKKDKQKPLIPLLRPFIMKSLRKEINWTFVNALWQCINCMPLWKSGVAQSRFGLEINGLVLEGFWCWLRRVLGSRRGLLAERAPIPCNLFHPAQHLHPRFFLKFSFNDFPEQSIVFSWSITSPQHKSLSPAYLLHGKITKKFLLWVCGLG